MTGKLSKHPKLILAFGDKKAIYTELDTPLSKSFGSWKSIENNMKEAISTFKLLLNKTKESNIEPGYSIIGEDDNGELQIQLSALNKAAIITYAKAFKGADARTVDLNEKIFKDIKLKELHAELIDLRDKLIAHTGISDYSSMGVIVAFPFDDDARYQLSFVDSSMVYRLKEDLQKYIEIAEYVLSHASKKAQKCAARLIEEEIKPNRVALFNIAKKENDEM